MDLPTPMDSDIPATSTTTPSPTDTDSAYASKPSPVPVSSKKRKRALAHEDDEEADPTVVAPPARRKLCAVEVVVPKIVNPRSAFGVRPAVKVKEANVLEEWLRDEEPGDGTDYIYYTIDEFTVYTAHDYVPKRGGDDVFPFKYPYEMIRLSALKIAQHINYVLVDGFLVNDQGERKYVEKMRVDCLSVGYSGGLGEPALWLQSMSNSELAVRNNRRWHGQTPLEHKRGLVWYQLGKPADVYKRYFDPFVWLATFGVYFFGFLESRWGDVGLLDFEQRFETWLRGKVEGADKAAEECFRAWIECVNDKVDFRIHVASHKEWLWNQMHSMDEFIAKFQHLTLWREIHSMDAIKRAYRGDHEPLTVVTPYVFKVFESMYGEHLKCVKPVPPPGATPKKFLLAGVVIETPSPKKLLKQPFVPKVGDVIWTSPDTTGKWKDKKPAEDQEPEKRWYAWITRIEWNKIYVVWLYKPSETILCVGDYPWPNELFFSDHCNCDSESGAMLMSEVAEKVEVVFHPKPGEEQEAEFFVRQKYRTNNPAFLTLRRSDVVLGNCACWEEELAVGSYAKARNDWVPGNSILYLPKRAKVLEPAIVVSFDDEDQAITIRYLKRLGSLQRGAVVPENEIVWTEEFEDIKAPAIHRRCFIRVFTHGEKVAAPYDRGGSGDMFYIRSEALRLHDGTESVVPFMRDNLREDELRQGFRLGEPPVKPMLRGMDLFCGGGNFGRGLEEGGVVSMKYAVDFDAAPLHSYRANMKHLDDTKLYLGSINNYLKDSIKGKFSDVVPAWDQVDFISAGSPCQGFSLANNHKGSANAIRKQSLVCSLATAIDIYRPKYAVLENVRGIAASRKRPDGGEDNTFTTMLCAVVGMGYQIESFLCDAWSHGNCQSRNRLILAITKAGYVPLKRPYRSHPHGNGGSMSGQLYKAPNGESFGFREASGPCPFGFMSAEKSWRYLPDIGDGHVGLSIRYPDHISASNPDTTMRMLMAHVPRFLRNNSWRAAIDTGRLHEVLWAFPQINEKMREDCRTYKRVSRDGLCRTITTTPTPQCTRTGTWVHHDANRLITVQEARIAQGYPDSDLLVGTPKNRLHVIGNSVARGVSLALGIGLREAYLASGSGGGFGAREKVRRVGAGGEAYGVVGEEGDGGAGVVIWGRIDRRKYVVIEDDSDVEMAEEKMVEG